MDQYRSLIGHNLMSFICSQVKPHAAAAAEGASPAMERRNEVTFLEHNLQQLTMNHKQVNRWFLFVVSVNIVWVSWRKSCSSD